MLSKDTKQPVEIGFYIAKDDGSVLSHETVFQLQLLDIKPRLEYLPQRATITSSAAVCPRKEVHAQSRSIKQQHGTEAAHSGSILANSRFPGEPYHIHLLLQSKHPADPYQYI